MWKYNVATASFPSAKMAPRVGFKMFEIILEANQMVHMWN